MKNMEDSMPNNLLLKSFAAVLTVAIELWVKPGIHHFRPSEKGLSSHSFTMENMDDSQESHVWFYKLMPPRYIHC